MSVVRDIQEFSRLFRIRIPVDKHFDFYIRTLSQSTEYAEFMDLAERFARFEGEIRGPVGSYKMDSVARVRDYIRQTEVWERYSQEEPPAGQMPIKQGGVPKGQFVYTFDLSQANFSVLKAFDDRGEIPESWEELLDRLDIHPMLAESKSLRQFIFGRLNPKGNQNWQSWFVDCLVNGLESAGLEKSRLRRISADELIYLTGQLDNGPEVWSLLDRIDEGLRAYRQLPHMPEVKLRGFIHHQHGDIAYRDIFDRKGEVMEYQYRSLHGVPGSLFFYYFRTLVLEQDVDPRDLLFQSENRVASWVPDEWSDD